MRHEAQGLAAETHWWHVGRLGPVSILQLSQTQTQGPFGRVWLALPTASMAGSRQIRR